MPNYDYKCLDCGTKEEIWQNFEDKPIEECPKCGSHDFYKVFQPVPFILKTTGFYKNSR